MTAALLIIMHQCQRVHGPCARWHNLRVASILCVFASIASESDLAFASPPAMCIAKGHPDLFAKVIGALCTK